MDQLGRYGSRLHPMFQGIAPYRDFVHFTSTLKPWMGPQSTTLTAAATTSSSSSSSTLSLDHVTSSKEYWYFVLQRFKQELLHNTTLTREFDIETEFDIDSLHDIPSSPIGQYPKRTDMIHAGRQRLRDRSKQHGSQ